jgi:hypothetical protein
MFVNVAADVGSGMTGGVNLDPASAKISAAPPGVILRTFGAM